MFKNIIIGVTKCNKSLTNNKEGSYTFSDAKN